MNDLQPIHCRFCQRDYVTTATTIRAQKCDLCGKTGGLIDPNVAAEAAREQFIERARDQPRERPRKPRVYGDAMTGAIVTPLLALVFAWWVDLFSGHPKWYAWIAFGFVMIFMVPYFLVCLYSLIRYGPEADLLSPAPPPLPDRDGQNRDEQETDATPTRIQQSPLMSDSFLRDVDTIRTPPPSDKS